MTKEVLFRCGKNDKRHKTINFLYFFILNTIWYWNGFQYSYKIRIGLFGFLGFFRCIFIGISASG